VKSNLNDAWLSEPINKLKKERIRKTNIEKNKNCHASFKFALRSDTDSPLEQSVINVVAVNGGVTPRSWKKIRDKSRGVGKRVTKTQSRRLKRKPEQLSGKSRRETLLSPI